jgi:hypothetical protein
MTVGDFYTTDDAARVLGVTARRVRQMLADGDLVRAARGLVDATSVEHYRARTGERHRTRAWAQHTAWGAIALLSDVLPDWLGPTQVSRLRGALREVSALDLVTRTRDRAVVRTFRAHPAAVQRLRDDVVLTDSSVLGLVDEIGWGGAALSGFDAEAAPDHIRGYYPASHLDSAVRFFGLQEEPTGNVIIRATDFDIAVVRDLAATTFPVLTALDAATSLHPRERGMGLGTLKMALDLYRP